MISVSISDALSIIDKGEWFKKWLMKQGAKAKEINKQSITRGVSIHKLIEDYHKGLIDADSDPKLILYVQWLNMHGLKHVGSEIKVKNIEKGYHGRLDNLYEDADGNLIICDTKTGKAIYEENRLQVIAYAFAYMAMTGKKIYKLCVVRVKEDGIIEDWFKPTDERHEIFLCARALSLHFKVARQ